MKKFTLTILCNAVLLLTLCLPADARMTIGLISTASPSGVTQGNIDGNRTINEICIKSAMMDYEVFRFLYLMVKVG